MARRIILDMTPAVRRRGGIGRYADELFRALRRDARAPDSGSPETSPYVAFVVGPDGPPDPGLVDHAAVTLRPQSEKAWRLQVSCASLFGWPLDQAIAGRPGDIFHATDHLLPPLSPGIRTVFTLHDLSALLVPHTHARLHSAFARVMMPRFLARADRVVSVSEFTRKTAIARYPWLAERIRTIHPGVDARFHPRPPEEIATVRARHGLGPRYVLVVSTLEPRKNLGRAIEAFLGAAPEGVELAIVGARGWRVDEALGTVSSRDLASAPVRFLGRVDDADLPALYSGAELFLYPSVYEGFGSPVLEAMSCGTPVLSSDATSLPEVLGDAGVLLPPHDAAAWVEAIRALLEPSARPRAREFGERGRKRAAGFTWAANATAMREIFEELRAPRP